MRSVSVNILLSIIALYSFGVVLTANAQFPERPFPPRLVNDFASFLTSNEAAALERKLVAYNDSTSNQIAIVTIYDLQGYAVSDYAFKLAENWGIGQKEKNNGALILVVKNSRDVFIATGYGLEDVLPDAICKRIVEKILIPNFRNGKFYNGLDEATDEMIARISGKFTAEKKPDGEEGGLSIISILMIFIFLIIFIISVSASSNRGNGRTISGRGVKRGHPVFWGTGRWGSNDGSGGGIGGGGFGGGFGGGGFGGFGGGSFGGGGAGGKW